MDRAETRFFEAVRKAREAKQDRICLTCYEGYNGMDCPRCHPAASPSPLPEGTTPTRQELTQAVTDYAGALCDHERGDPNDFDALDKVARTRNALGLVVDALYAAQRPVSPSEPPKWLVGDADILERIATDHAERGTDFEADADFLRSLARRFRIAAASRPSTEDQTND